MRRAQSSNRAHNYELFELAKILTIKREEEVENKNIKPKKKVQEVPCKFYCVKSAGWVGHAFIAAVTTNNYVILRYVGTGKIPIVRQFEWFKTDEKRNKILNMAWCPFAHHLIILTSDLTIILVPAANLVLASNTKFGLSNIPQSASNNNARPQTVKLAPPQYKLGQPSHLGPSNDITVIAAHRKSNDVHHTAHILWWRTTELIDYSITVSSRGSIRFVNLHTQVFEKQSSIRLANVKLVIEASIIKDSNRTYLLIQSNQEEVFQIVLEQEVEKGVFKNIISTPNKHPFVPAVRRGFFPEGSLISIQETQRRGTLIGSFDPTNNKLEVYDTDLSTYALFVYQLVPGTSLAQLTDKLVFAVTYDSNELSGTSHIFVISNLISATSSGSQQLYKKNQRESIMQEFRIHGEKVRGIFRAFPNQFNSPNKPVNSMHTELEGFLLWTSDGIYECRQKLSPETIFYQLISQGLEKSDAEPLGKTLGLDILSLYELAADKYFESGNIGRALDLYFLSNVQTDKLVYKFLEVGRIDIVITHLRSSLRQADSLSVQDRKRLANVLLYCYIQKLANYEGANFNEAKSEFTIFLNSSSDYNKLLAARLLLGCGLVEDMFTVWHSGLEVQEGLKLLLEAGSIDLGSQALRNLRKLLKSDESNTDSMHSQLKLDHQDILLESPLFISLTPDEQVMMLLSESMRIPRYFRRIINNVPLIDESTLISVVTFFDPLGQNMINLMKEESYSGSFSENSFQFLMKYSPSEIDDIDKDRCIGQEEYLECFIIALLALCFKRTNDLKYQPSYPNPSASLSSSFDNYSTEEVHSDAGSHSQSEELSESNLSANFPEALSDGTPSSFINSPNLPFNRPLVKTSSGVLYQSITSKIVKKLSCGWAHSCAIVDNGELFTWGANKFGQLGLNIPDEFISTPTKVAFFQKKRIYHVSCGGEHTIAITEKRETYSWGSGNSGQLGHGDKNSLLAPKLIEAIHSIPMKQSACGFYHSLLITNEGKVYSFGANSKGELGLSNTRSTFIPTIIPHLEDSAEVACGWAHSLLRTEHGEVYSWGSGVYGQLGHGNTSDISTPKQIDELQGKRIRKIGCGAFHSAAITDLENVYTWGRGNKFRLGHGSDQSDQTVPKLVNALLGKHSVSVDGGYVHTVVGTSKGEVYSWGCSKNGQLGLGKYDDIGSPQLIVALKGIKIKQVHCGEEFTVVLSQDGKLFSFGSSNYGQLGIESIDRSNIPAELSFQEKISYRVLGSNASDSIQPEQNNNLNSNQNNNSNLSSSFSEMSLSNAKHSYNQELLEITLKNDFTHYRPTIIIQQSIDWRNWEAASVVYQMMGDWPECFHCRLQGLRYVWNSHRLRLSDDISLLKQSKLDMAVAALKIFELYVLKVTNENVLKILLQMIFDYWMEQELPVNLLENVIKKNIVNLAQSMGELLESNPERFPPFTSEIYLHVTNVSLRLMKKELKKSTPVKEHKMWESILENLDNHLPKKGPIVISNETAEKLSKSFAKSIINDRSYNSPSATSGVSDSLAFSCGHCYTKKYFYEELLVEFEKKMSSNRSLYQTMRFTLDDYTQKLVLESCPNCLYASLRKLNK